MRSRTKVRPSPEECLAIRESFQRNFDIPWPRLNRLCPPFKSAADTLYTFHKCTVNNIKFRSARDPNWQLTSLIGSVKTARGALVAFTDPLTHNCAYGIIRRFYSLWPRPDPDGPHVQCVFAVISKFANLQLNDAMLTKRYGAGREPKLVSNEPRATLVVLAVQHLLRKIIILPYFVPGERVTQFLVIDEEQA